jgi:RNA polymerase sigma-70 factor, ECF subfamily
MDNKKTSTRLTTERLPPSSAPPSSRLSVGVSAAESRFRRLYDEHLPIVAAYASRRTSSPEDAADVVAETFLVAWRRVDAIPSRESHLWLLGVARNVLWSRDRAERRRRRLGAKLAQAAAFRQQRSASDENDRGLAHAFAELADADKDILGMVAWEGLDAAAIATVLNCSTNAAKIRLHRARARLRAALSNPETKEETDERHTR